MALETMQRLKSREAKPTSNEGAHTNKDSPYWRAQKKIPSLTWDETFLNDLSQATLLDKRTIKTYVILISDAVGVKIDS